MKPYLEALYGSPVVFNSNNLFGTVIAGLLERPTDSHEKKEVLAFRVFDKLGTSMFIYLPNTWKKEYRFGFKPSGNGNYFLSNKANLNITKFFEQQFEEDLHKFCEFASIYKQQTKKAIEEFCYRHRISIEEDITYDCLKKKQQRCKQQQKLLQQNPPELSRHFYTSKKII